MRRFASITACALLATGALLAPTAASAKSTTQNVNLRFTAVAGDDAVRCGTPISGLGTTGQTAQLRDLRFFVSQVALIRKEGKAVRVKLRGNKAFSVIRGNEAVTLIDLENATGACAEEGTKATNASVRGTVPRGKYTGVRWTLGVPPNLNHTDTTGAPGPLSNLAMGWSWQFGRKFLKIEYTDPAGPQGSWPASTFFVHLGSTGCTGDPAAGKTARCRATNRPTVKLAKLDPAKQRVAVDVRALVAGNDITVNGGDAPGCMSAPTDPECPAMFRALGMRGPQQTLFRAVR